MFLGEIDTHCSHSRRLCFIVVQFTFAVILIAFTWIIHRQLQFAQARDMGYDKSRLVSFQIDDRSRRTRELMRRELLETGVAETVGFQAIKAATANPVKAIKTE